MLNKITLGLCALSFLGCIAGIIGANRGLLPASSGMYLFALSGLTGLFAAICALAIIFTSKTYPVAMIGFLGLIPFVTLAALASQGSKYPMMNDVATNLDDVPTFQHAQTLPENAGRDFAYPEDFKPLVRDHYSDVEPLVLNGSIDAVFTKVRVHAEKRIPGCEITRIDEARHEIEGVVSTRVFRWKDDIIIRVRPGDGDTCIVDMRSKSRDGRSDLGANAKRIQNFFDVLQTAP